MLDRAAWAEWWPTVALAAAVLLLAGVALTDAVRKVRAHVRAARDGAATVGISALVVWSALYGVAAGLVAGGVATMIGLLMFGNS